jgi:hypothetical protein
MKRTFDQELELVRANADAAQIAYRCFDVLLVLFVAWLVIRGARWLVGRHRGPKVIEQPYLWVGFTKDEAA